MTKLVNVVSINEFIELHKSGTFGVYCVTITEPSLTGGKKCPFLGRVLKATFIQNAILGISYDGAINGAERRSGIEIGTFESAKLPWGEWVNYPYTIHHKGMNYLRLFQNKATKMHSIYFVDGIEVSKDDLIDGVKLSDYLKKSAPSKKQSEAGIDETEQIRPLSYKYESIACIIQKDKMYLKNVGITVEHNWVKEMFKSF